MNAALPQTDREWLIQLNENVKDLTTSIGEFGQIIKDLEEKKIGAMDKRISKIESTWQQISGAWKLVMVLWAIFTAGGLVGWLMLLINK